MKKHTYGVLLILIFSLALGIRMYFNLHFIPPEKSDMPYLHKYAQNVVAGQYYGTNGAYWPPGFIFFAGLILKTLGDTNHYLDLRLVQSLISALNVLLIAVLGTKVFNKLTGLIAGAIAAIYMPLVLFSGLFFSETFFFFLFLLMLYAFYNLIAKFNVKNAIISGILLGLTTLTRPITLLMPGLLFIWLLFKYQETGFKKIICSTGVVIFFMFLTMSPWIARNYAVMGKPVLVDVNGGLNFYLAHNPKANGKWVDLGRDNVIFQYKDQPETDRVGYQLGFQYIADNPEKELTLLGTKMKLFWLDTPKGMIAYYSGSVLTGIYDRFHLPKVHFYFLVLLGLIGVLLSIKNYSAWFLISFMVYYSGLITVVFYYSARYRLAVEPILIIFMSYTISTVFSFVGRSFGSKACSPKITIQEAAA